jgi:hypothetical protein
MTNEMWVLFGVVGSSAVASLIAAVVRRFVRRQRPVTLANMLLANVLDPKGLVRR